MKNEIGLLQQLVIKIRARAFRLEEKFRPFRPVESANTRIIDETPIDPVLLDELNQKLKEIEHYISRESTADLSLARLLYATVRTVKPEAVVETGVWHGVSSFVILSAMEASGCGTLHSVDMPPLKKSNRVVVGAAVPERLRGRWKLNVCPSLEYLKRDMPQCDIFIHDSEHTYRNMLLEFRLAWPRVRKGGMIISDDAHSNAAICDFAKEVGAPLTLIRRQKGGFCGIIVKG